MTRKISVVKVCLRLKGANPYLDFDELLYAICNNKVLVPVFRLAHEDFVTRLEPPPIVIPNESFRVGLFVVEIAEND